MKKVQRKVEITESLKRFVLIFITIILMTGYPTFNPAILIVRNNSNDHSLLSNVSYASVIQEADSLNYNQTEKEKSDLFYYILGIIILIVSGIIFKQRYYEYLRERKKL